MAKNQKTNKRSEFYVYRVVREQQTETAPSTDETPKEEHYIISPRYGKQTVNIKNESMGYRRNPSAYDSIRPDRKLRQESYSNYRNSVEKSDSKPKNTTSTFNQDLNYDYPHYSEEINNHTIDDIPEDVFNYDYDDTQKPSVKPSTNNIRQEVLEKRMPRVSNVNSMNERNSKNIETINNSTSVEKTIPQVNIGPRPGKYIPPKIEFLEHSENNKSNDIAEAERQKAIINQTLKEANIKASVAEYIFGPTVTQFLIKVEPGVNVKSIATAESNLTMYLEAESIRLQTPIPGKPFAGIEVPKKKEYRKIVHLGNLINNPQFKKSHMALPIAVGQDNYGTYMYIDIAEMPHCLIAGTTKSGKSVALNTFLLSLIYKFSPRDVRFVLIDPKRIELGVYEGIPHLAMPVIIDQEDFTPALTWLFEEMERRYSVFEVYGERNIVDLNQRLVEERKPKLPYIIMIMDEFSDWISSAGQEAENMLQRIAQKARAAGIHIVLAAQRPSKDVIKGSIKANFDTRLAFKVSSFDDAKVILGSGGAEKLEGYGDMLIRYAGHPEKRLQGAFVANSDVKQIVKYLKDNNQVEYIVTKEELRQSAASRNVNNANSTARNFGVNDPIFEEVAYFVVRNQNASANSLQRQFGTGFNRMNDIFLGLEELGIVSKTAKGKQREVLVSEFDLEKILENR